jgi:hypothetical protein
MVIDSSEAQKNNFDYLNCDIDEANALEISQNYNLHEHPLPMNHLFYNNESIHR